MQNLVVVSHTVCATAHVRGSEVWGTLTLFIVQETRLSLTNCTRV